MRAAWPLLAAFVGLAGAPARADLYASCDGETHHPGLACRAGECAPDATSKAVFELWRETARALAGLDEKAFGEHVEVSKVQRQAGPLYDWVRIEAVFVAGWARVRLAASVNLGAFPHKQAPTQAELQRAVQQAVRPVEWKDAARTLAVLPVERLQQGAGKCGVARLDWCHVSLSRGHLDVRGIGAERGDNRCPTANGDLNTGEVECGVTACRVF